MALSLIKYNFVKQTGSSLKLSTDNSEQSLNKKLTGCNSYVDEDSDETPQSGFTNKFLESRANNELFSVKYSDFKTIEESAESPDSLYRDVLKTIMERTPVSDLFFSKENRDRVKGLIAKEVLDKSEGLYRISPDSQSDEQLIIIMRAIYLQHGRNLPDNIHSQVVSLNEQVLLEVVPKVISNIQQELVYRRDVGSQPLPMAHPICVNISGTKLNRGFL